MMAKYKHAGVEETRPVVVKRHTSHGHHYGGMVSSPSSADGLVSPSSGQLDLPGGDRMPGLVYLLTVLSAIGGFLFGYDTGVVSGSMLLIRDVFNLSDNWHEAIVSGTIGAAWIFALFGGFLSDLLGRKPVIIIASVTFTAGAIVMGAANSKEILLLGRVIVGVGIGLTSAAVPFYIAECVPRRLRARLTSYHMLMTAFGQMCACCVDGALSSLPRSISWRYMLGLAGIPSVIQLVGMLWMPESPRWLVAHGRMDAARDILRRTRGGSEDSVDEEMDSIRLACEEDKACQEESGTSFVLFRIVLSTAVRRALLLGCLLQMYQQLSGINTVMYYSASIIRMAGVSDSSMAIWLAAGVASVNFVFTFVGLYLVEKAGRRKLTLGSLAGVVLALVFLAVGFQLSHMDAPPVQSHQLSKGDCAKANTCSDCMFISSCGFCYESLPGGVVANGSCLPVSPSHAESHSAMGECKDPVEPWAWAYGFCPSRYSWLIVAGLCIYLVFFAPGMGPMPWTINSEIYPLWARSTCTSIATSVCWLFNLLVSMTFLTLTNVLTQYGAFYLYAGLAASGLVILYLLLPETKGVSLEDMEILFSQSWCCPGRSVQVDGSVGGLTPTRRAEDSSSVQYVHIRGLNRDCRPAEYDSPDSDS